MADISITPGNVLKGTDAVVESGTAGETITAGQVVYKAAASGRFLKADANATGAEARTPRGIALNGASDGQPLTIQKSGQITIGGTMTAGIQYYLSDTAGGICPVADIGSGEYVAPIGVSKSTTVLLLNIAYSGVSL